ncbi:acetylxylan esterase [Ructibacterium gallinarum]|uniref:Acetylxylan esterase n=1 Tax=Ructibacterium gallinarum TaxID=2779355 RepID=A0A9D5R7M9_9FIRM|nr:alpha/beta fold hydrolase [Ructibacterium gallinarum]MBE5039386.1 acetylxylan esterase [Ructibacterium gallinarum]
MPILDMPIEELRRYQGRNPRPEDFDAYWERALAELDQTDMQVNITKSEFQMPNVECFDVYFTGVKGGRIYAKLLKPMHIVGRAPAAIKFHGYSAQSGDWVQNMALVATGFVVAALDTRGQGGKSEDINPVKGNTLNGHIIRGLDDPDADNMLFRQCFLDTAALARIVMGLDYVDEGRVAAMGGSQGGGLTLACAALEPRIAKVVPTHPFLSDYKRVWEMDLAMNAYEEICNFFRWYDPCHLREEEIFTKLGYIDVQHLASRIKGEVYLTTGLMDNICPPSTVFAAYNHIKAKKTIRIYPDFGHEYMPGHDDGVFQFLKDLL